MNPLLYQTFIMMLRQNIFHELEHVPLITLHSTYVTTELP